MKKWMFSALGGLLMIAAITNCSDDKKETKEVEVKAPEVPTVDPKGLKIAFYNADSLNAGFTYLKEQEAVMNKKQQNFENEMIRRQKNLEKRYNDLVEADQKQLYTAADMMAKKAELEKLSMSFQNYQQTEGEKIQKEAMEIRTVLHNRVDEFAKKYCEKYKLDMLMMYTPGGQVTYYNPKMDVTKSFIQFVNAEHAKM